MSNNDTANASFQTCSQVSIYCPVEATTLGYYPNLGLNVFFAVAFGLAFLATTTLGVWKRTWAFSGFVAAGTVLELAGYAARVPLHGNPWNSQAFQAQICAIILGPTLLCIAIYLTLQHICQALCPPLSRIRPKLYPWIFVPADISCLVIQALGGGIAASASKDMANINRSMLNAGNRAIIAGIALQVVVLAAFGTAALDFYLRLRKWIQGKGGRAGRVGRAVLPQQTQKSKLPRAELAPPTQETLAMWHNRRFRWFIRAVTGAYSCILIRCIYRIAEMAGGWGNKIMQDEPSFVVLEGFMILIAVVFLTAVPPGIFFPFMSLTRKQRAAHAEAASEDAHDTAGAEDTEKTDKTEKSTATTTADGPSGSADSQGILSQDSHVPKQV